MGTTTAAREPATDRRGAVGARLALDPDPKRLRHSLERVTDALPTLEPETARKVRHLVVEIIARSFDRERPTGGLICLDVSVLPTTVRVEARGKAVSPERWERGGGAVWRFPAWAVGDLAARWARDRRTAEPTIWFLVERVDAQADGGGPPAPP